MKRLCVTITGSQAVKIFLAVLSVFASGPLCAGTEGGSNTFYGNGAGAGVTGSSISDTYIGANAGVSNTGSLNTFLGWSAGYGNISGDGNVFLGYAAGLGETGSYKLYIDDCYTGGSCTSPLIYGEFNNHVLKFNGVTQVAADGVAKSQMHFSLNLGDSGGWLTSVLDNNFFVSSGARYDGTAGGWIQRSPDTNAVIAGSGGVGYRIFTHTGSAVGTTFTPTVRLHIDYSGQLGVNTAPVAGHEIHASSGAHLTAGGVWTDASSREYKEHIRPLSAEQALRTLNGLDPMLYNYKANSEETHVGFIAEDVPELVASPDRKSLSPMDIVAVLTKVVQEQKQALDEKSRALDEVQGQMALLLARMQRLESLNNTAQR